jgi:glycosyltransferase involved in cell wall biosynthesis
LEPRVSIGLPVYNGERYLRAAVDSLLGQTFSDFELIISDNASDDATGEIAREYARNDRRVRYFGSDKNRGAAWNFNRVFKLARGRYFKWAAHDDVCAPEFLERCIRVLDERPEIVLCAVKTSDIDESGRTLPSRTWQLRFDSPRPHKRFHDLICRSHSVLAIFGLVRSEVLARTAMIGAYVGADRVLLAELSLHGPFHEVPECLLFRREHAGRSTRAHPREHSRAAWFDPLQNGRVTFPTWRLLREYAAAVRRSPLGRRGRFRCRLQLLPWLWKKKKRLRQDVTKFLFHLPTARRRRFYAADGGTRADRGRL